MVMSSDSEGSECPMPDPRALRLDRRFDCCVLDVTPDGRLVYSTDRMEGVLARCGMPEEPARALIMRHVRNVRPWAPDFLD